MRTAWVRREIAAPAADLWALVSDTDEWARWGPTVSRAHLDGDGLAVGRRGVVTSFLGLDLPFEITEMEPGRSWSWKVAGVRATEHEVEPLGQGRCRVGFGVPWPAAPYLLVCHVALRRLAGLVAGRVKASRRSL